MPVFLERNELHAFKTSSDAPFCKRRYLPSPKFKITPILLRAEEKGKRAKISYFSLQFSYGSPNLSSNYNIAISVFEPFMSGRKSALEFIAQDCKNSY